MPLIFLPENPKVDESYCSQLWVETERDGDHQAHDTRNADVTEGSNQQRVFLKKFSSAREMTSSQIPRTNPAYTGGGILNVKTMIGKADGTTKNKQQKVRKCVKMKIKNTAVLILYFHFL